MFRRVFLAFTFVAALGAAGLGMNSKATAGHGCYDDFGYSYRYPAYYSYYGYGPRLAYYPSHRAYYGDFDGHRHGYHHHHGHHHHDHGVRISFGF
jgi:hypothetical protein